MEFYVPGSEEQVISFRIVTAPVRFRTRRVDHEGVDSEDVDQVVFRLPERIDQQPDQRRDGCRSRPLQDFPMAILDGPCEAFPIRSAHLIRTFIQNQTQNIGRFKNAHCKLLLIDLTASDTEPEPTPKDHHDMPGSQKDRYALEEFCRCHWSRCRTAQVTTGCIR